MWTHSLRWQDNLSDDQKSLLKKFSKYSKITGIVFIVLGAIGIVFPFIISMVTVAFVSYLMVVAGLASGYFTWITNKEDWLGWLKSLVLFLMGIFILIYPIHGVAAIGLMLVIYFFMDAFAGFGLAMSMRGNSGWWVWLLNASLSLLLGVVFMAGWPFSSTYLVGLFIGISLFFDGIAMLAGGSIWKKLGK
jgi:uncharacterized membrane protein HdeD (DUF308 family)